VERRVDIDWREVEGEVVTVRLAVSGEDRRGLYAEIREAISETGTNIKSADLASKDGAVFGSVLVEIGKPHAPPQGAQGGAQGERRTDIARRDSGSTPSFRRLAFWHAFRTCLPVSAGGDQPRAIAELSAGLQRGDATRLSSASPAPARR